MSDGLEARNIVKTFDSVPVLRGVDLRVPEGAIIALLGPSGCGKSTLLRIIAGLEQADSGEIWHRGRRVDSVAVHARGFGLMFQEWALFPHRSVAENIAFGLKMAGASRERQTAQVEAMLALVGLSGYGERSVFALSGGERQRVALARALAPEPGLLMLDEPLGSLDRTLRERLTDDLRAIIRQAGVTAIYVTHDQHEAFSIADEIVIMQAGSVAQRGRARELYRHPASEFVARFLSLNNLLEVSGSEDVGAGQVRVATVLGRLLINAEGVPADAKLLVRPEAARISAAEEGALSGAIERVVFRGATQRLVWRHRASGTALELEISAERSISEGDELHIELEAGGMGLISGGPVPRGS